MHDRSPCCGRMAKYPAMRDQISTLTARTTLA
jgi:hypothetical protein